MQNFERDITPGAREKKEQERYNTVRDVINQKAMANWQEVGTRTTKMSPERKSAYQEFESCMHKYGDTEFRKTQWRVYDEALEQSTQYEGLLMDKLYMNLSRINDSVMIDCTIGKLPDEELKRVRSQGYEDARQLLKDVAGIIGKEKAKTVLDKWHENTKPLDYLAQLQNL